MHTKLHTIIPSSAVQPKITESMTLAHRAFKSGNKLLKCASLTAPISGTVQEAGKPHCNNYCTCFMFHRALLQPEFVSGENHGLKHSNHSDIQQLPDSRTFLVSLKPFGRTNDKSPTNKSAWQHPAANKIREIERQVQVAQILCAGYIAACDPRTLK